MKHRKQHRFLTLIAAMLAALSISGCSKEVETMREAPGTLIRVTYEQTNGSVWGQDFEVNLTPENIQFASYYVAEQSDYQSVIDEPITEAQWLDVEAAAIAVVKEVTPMEEPHPLKQLFVELLNRNVEVMDGGDKNALTLVWDTDAGERVERYLHSSAESYSELVELLKELVIPE